MSRQHIAETSININKKIELEIENKMLKNALDRANKYINHWYESSMLLYAQNQKLKKILLELEGVARETQPAK